MAAVVPNIDHSALEKLLQNTPKSADYPEHLQDLALQIAHNLEYQHRWTDLRIHTHSLVSNRRFPRPLILGMPPKRLYVHPDEQVAIIQAESRDQGGSAGERSQLEVPILEWVLPSHLREKWSLRRFTEVFDALDERDTTKGGDAWREEKRVVLATAQDDSTIVYYIMHDGIVKPRQN